MIFHVYYYLMIRNKSGIWLQPTVYVDDRHHTGVYRILHPVLYTFLTDPVASRTIIVARIIAHFISDYDDMIIHKQKP